MTTPDELLRLDRAHVWHPYGPMPGRSEPFVVSEAAGAVLTLADGRELIDGMSSWWSAIHGYRHPALDEAVRDQLGRMSHVMFGGLTHEPAVTLARTLVDLTLGLRVPQGGALGGLEIQGTVSNLFDENYYAGTGSTNTDPNGTFQGLGIGAPRQVFVTLRKRF